MPNRQTRRALQGKGRNKGGTKWSYGPGGAPPERPLRAADGSGPEVRYPEATPRKAPQGPEGAEPEQDGGPDPLELVRRASAAHHKTGEALRSAVGQARSVGATWAQIGAALGMTRQAAWERFR